MSTVFDLLTLKQAAAALGVTPDYLRHQAQNDFGWLGDQSPLAKRIELRKIGRDWYATKTAVDAEIERRR